MKSIRLKILPLVLLLTLSVANTSFGAPTSGVVKLVNLLVTKHFDTLFAKKGLNNANELIVYTKRALRALNTSDSSPSGGRILVMIDDISKKIETFPLYKTDTTLQDDYLLTQKILIILNKNQKDVDADELIEVINGLISLTGRYSNRGAFVYSCKANCMNKSLKKVGLKATLELVESKKIQKILNRQINRKNPTQLKQFIKTELKKLGISDLPTGKISKHDEKTLALFLVLIKKGTKQQKKYCKKVLALSKSEDGTYLNLFEHRLWANLGALDNPKKIAQWNDILDAVIIEYGTNIQTGKKSLQSAWEKVLRSRAKNNPEMHELMNKLIINNCFI